MSSFIFFNVLPSTSVVFHWVTLSASLQRKVLTLIVTADGQKRHTILKLKLKVIPWCCDVEVSRDFYPIFWLKTCSGKPCLTPMMEWVNYWNDHVLDHEGNHVKKRPGPPTNLEKVTSPKAFTVWAKACSCVKVTYCKSLYELVLVFLLTQSFYELVPVFWLPQSFFKLVLVSPDLGLAAVDLPTSRDLLHLHSVTLIDTNNWGFTQKIRTFGIREIFAKFSSNLCTELLPYVRCFFISIVIFIKFITCEGWKVIVKM